MANFIVSPNMSLVIPSVLAEAGPLYAQDINGSLFTVDSHNHSPGSGVPITPSGLNISSDLTFQSQNAINLRSSRYTLYPTMGDFNPTASDLSCVFFVGVDLYAIDGSGNQIQITKSGFVNSGAGSISGLSGFPNASASYNGATGTFVWEQGIGQAANMDAATLIIRYPGSYPTPSGNFIALQAPSALSTGYALTYPLTLPGVNNSWMVSDTSGSESWIASDNSTIEVNSSLLRVKPGGITTTQISSSANILGTQLDPSANILGSQLANLTVTGSKIANATVTIDKQPPMTGSQTATLGNLAVSPSCGSFSLVSSPAAITNLSVTITTGGRPIWIGFQNNNGGTSFCSMSFDGSSTATVNVAINESMAGQVSAYSWKIKSNGTDVLTNNFSLQDASTIYNVGAGTYTFTAYQSYNISSGTLSGSINNMFLVAYEI